MAFLSKVPVVDLCPDAAGATICFDVFIGCGCKSMFSLAKVMVSESGPFATDSKFCLFEPTEVPNDSYVDTVVATVHGNTSFKNASDVAFTGRHNSYPLNSLKRCGVVFV